MKTKISIVLAFSLVLVCLGLFVACGGGSNPMTSNQMGTVNVSVSDPPTCGSSTGGPYANIWVTIKDVLIHQSATASASDSGWVDLTPNLSSAPMQVDMLGIANSTCFLAMLGSKTEIQAGTYQQIRIILGTSADAGSLSTNHCSGTDVNCVVLASDSSVHTLLLSSEANTGLKIPSGQIAGGAFTIGAGEVKDLNIDIDGCASIVAQGGKYRLKPVLHAGEVALTSTSVTGTLVDSISMTAIIGGKAIVALEQKDASGIDRVIMQTTPDSSGNFVLCPVPAGTYDVVAVAVNGSNVAYAATITTGVQPGNALGKVPMIAQIGAPQTDASLTGNINTTTGSAATSADITLFAMQSVTISGLAVNVIIPLAQQQSATASASTVSGTCPANNDCVSYTLAVPAMQPNVGAYAASGATYTQSTAVPVQYSVGADSSLSGMTDCNPNEVIVGPVTVTPGTSSAAPDLNFTSCT